MKISILVPTRQRRNRLIELYDSMFEYAKYPANVEMVAYVDDDDKSYNGLERYNLNIITGKHTRIADAWNICWKNAEGEILGLFGDDVICRTQDWDKIVTNEFNKLDDKIAFVYGDDGSDAGKTFGTHGFIHQNWAETVGYFVPPYFYASYVDTWLNDVAKMVNRHKYVDVLFEHMHQGMGKSEDDETYKEARRMVVGMEDLYNAKLQERNADARKLIEFMEKK